MLSFRTPDLGELGQRQAWLSDPDFMSYNAGWEIDHPSYDPASGCIAFPPEQWATWHVQWIGQPDREYWYVIDDAGNAVGHAHYRLVDEETPHIEIGAAISPAFRGRGYGREVFTQLIERVRKRHPRLTIRQQFEPGRIAAERIHLELGFRVVSTDPGERVVHTWELSAGDPAPLVRPSWSMTNGST